jgi:ligand-binding sensor domain-containing protein
MDNRLLLASLFFLQCVNIKGQSFNEKNFVHYSVQQGLSDNYISGLKQDSAGYIWISTHHGLNRFDGSYFKQFFNDGTQNSITDNSIFSMDLLPNQELALATENGAQIISTASLKSKKLDIPTADILRYWSNACKYVLSDQHGNYGVSTKTGFYVFSNEGKLIKRFDKFTEEDIGHKWMNFGNYIYQLPDGNMMQQNDFGLQVFDRYKKAFTEVLDLYPAIESLKPKLRSIRYFFISRNDLLIMNTETNSFDLVNIKTGQKKSFASGLPLIDEISWQTNMTPVNDSVWAFNCKAKGFYLLYIDTLQQTVRRSSQKYFKDFLCTSILSDRNGKLWVGTPKGFFMEKKNPGIITSFAVSTPDQSSDFAITGLHISTDKIFAGTDKEEILVLNKQTKKIISRVHLKRIYSSEAIPYSFLQVHPDTLWTMTSSGLYWIHTSNFTTGRVFSSTLPIITNSPVLFIDSKKNIWIGTESINRVYRYNRKTNELYEINAISDPLFNINMCHHIAEDKDGNIWLGGDAIARWNTNSSKIDTLIQHLPTQRNRKKGYAVMNDSKGAVWAVVNDDGIVKITGDNLPLHARPPNFLQDNSQFVYPTLLADKIFIATSAGVGLFSMDDQKAVIFSEVDGLPAASDISTIKFAMDPSDQSVWFAKQNIICIIPDRVDNIYMFPPALSISELTVIKGDVHNYPQEKVSLKYFQNDIKISLSALNFNDPGNMRFAYRFRDNNDSSWIDIGTQQNILLTNISPGTYKLQAKVYGYDNKWADSITEIEIVIKPPFWKTLWFMLGIVLLVAGAAYYLYNYRINQINQRANLDKLLAQTEMKALHTQMNPHFIFNCLNSIKKMILDNENGKASRYLSKFAQLIRITLNQSSKSFISLHNTIDYLQRYLEMEQVRTNTFRYTIETDNELNPEDIYMPPMLIQPLIENAIWHGELPEHEILDINIRFHKQEYKLLCIVEDNGIGIEASLKKKEDTTLSHHSLGIANIRQRIQVLNEKYNLHSTLNIEDKSALSLGNGTISTLILPIKNTDS